MFTDYLTDADRERMAAEARAYAQAAGWSARLVEKFGEYHVNRNEMVRQDLAITADGFRIVHELDR
jgi:hypothetical protein